MSSASTPDFAMAVRAGTPGLGLDLDLGLSPSFGIRVGFSGFNLQWYPVVSLGIGLRF
ncbi:MAG: hypothetical protein WBV35_00100 [Steroidobacteraceae bacterium]